MPLPRYENLPNCKTIHAPMRVAHRFISMKVHNSFRFGINVFCIAYNVQSREPMLISIKGYFAVALSEIEKCRPTLLLV